MGVAAAATCGYLPCRMDVKRASPTNRAGSAASAGRPMAHISSLPSAPAQSVTSRRRTTPARKSFTPSPRTSRARRIVVASTGGGPTELTAAVAPGSADGVGSTRATSSSIGHLPTSSGATTYARRHHGDGPGRTITKTSRRSSGASPAMPAPARSPRRTASGSRSSATATAGITCTSMPARRRRPAMQITKGKFEAWRPTWSPDGTRHRVRRERAGNNHGNRQLVRGGDQRRSRTRNDHAGHQRSRHEHRAGLVAGRHGASCTSTPTRRTPRTCRSSTREAARQPVRLTDSMPAAIDRVGARRAGDGALRRVLTAQQVPAWLFVPKNLDRPKKHPAIVWIHGDGVNQNYDGWHVQRNYAVYYSFHQYLLQQGYVVIAPDYRGSIGYGKAWREASTWTSAARTRRTRGWRPTI